jgi:hypothetical protein
MIDTDPVPADEGGSEGGNQTGRYGFFATLFGLPTLEQRIKELLMARLDPITTSLGNISTQLTQLSTQIGELQAGTVSQEEIDAVAAQAQSIADAVDAAIEPDAGEGEPPTETPTP